VPRAGHGVKEYHNFLFNVAILLLWQIPTCLLRKELVVVLVYVDDLIVIGDDEVDIQMRRENL